MEQENSPPSADSLSADLAHVAALLQTDPAAAEQRAWEILGRAPGQRYALALIVQARRLAGGIAGARALLEKLALAEPELAAVQYEFALVLAELGDSAASNVALQRVVALEPQHPSAWRALGDQLAKAGKVSEASKAYASHFAVTSAGFAGMERASEQPPNQLGKAESALRAWLAIYPTDVSVQHMLAVVDSRRGRFEDAATLLSQTVALSPNYEMARRSLAIALARQDEWEKALVQLDILLSQNPDDADYLSLKAHGLLNSGAYDAAVAAFKLLVEKDPSASSWMHYGYALGAVGRQQEGIAALKRALALSPALGEAYWTLANLKTYRFTPAEITTMRQVVQRTDVDQRSRALTHFALGKSLEDSKQYAPSFRQYLHANSYFRQATPYTAADTTKFVRSSKALFTKEFFVKRAGSGSSAPDPIFIVGLPRSGSTLIEQILASHSQIEGTKELAVLMSIAMRVSDPDRSGVDGYPDVLRDMKADRFKALGEEYLARTRVNRKLGRPFFIDKTPSNFHHIGLIQLMLPNAKIIDARRHPLGCGFAVFRQYFPQRLPFASDLAEIGSYYRDYVELMAHYDAVLPRRVHRVFYEEMVANPDDAVRRLLDYLQLPFEEGCLRFYENKRAVVTPSAEQVRQPIFTDALEQWKHFEPGLGPMKSALGDVLTLYPAVPNFVEPPPVSTWGLSANYQISPAPAARTDSR